MATDLGKKWEAKFSDSWKASFPDSDLARLYDQVTKFKDVSQNPSDYYCLLEDKLLYLECKETKGNTLNFAAFPQLDRLLEKEKYKNIFGYVIIWFSQVGKVIMVKASEADKIRADGNKSISLKMLEQKLYSIIEVPTEIKRLYPVCDFNQIKEVILCKS